MTEQEWLQATDPQPMLEFLRGKASDRKLRLFAVACCRRIWHLLTEKGSRVLVEITEQFVGGGLDQRQFAARIHELIAAGIGMFPARTAERTGWAVALASQAAWAATGEGQEGAGIIAVMETANTAAAAEEQINPTSNESHIQCDLLRCIFGNPFRSITFDPTWLTWHDGLLVSMAQRMYDTRDFSDMPVLADALEEADCQDQDILDHCRSGGEHVRGCWLVDLLLRRS